MNLVSALRLSWQTRLALVGAGGKTTLLFRLARELLSGYKTGAQDTAYGNRPPPTVLVSTTTHLAVDQLAKGDHTFCVQSRADIDQLGDHLPAGVLVVTGSGAESGRVKGLNDELIDALYHLAEKYELPLLVEADGARQKSLKAPAEHEPVIPDWVEVVVVMAGLTGIDRPLTVDHVHRPERFCRLADLEPGAPVSILALARVMLHPAGGFKGLPPHARRVALLNQADTVLLQALGGRLAEFLIAGYASVLVAAAQLPDPVIAVREKIAGIVLAAGQAERMGQPKQLMLYQDETLVHRAARLGIEAGLDRLVVVTGAYEDAIAKAVADLEVITARNPDYLVGQSTSVIAGLRALEADTGAVVFLLADQPLVTPQLIRSLAAYHAQTLAPLVAPLVDDHRANPVLFDRITFPDLMALQGDTGGRAIFPRYRMSWLPWLDAKILIDVDTLTDYQQLMELA